MSERCAYVSADCKGEARWYPVLLLFAAPNTTPARSIFGVPHCDVCHHVSNLDNIVTDEGWRAISTVFRRLNRGQPRRELIELEWILIDSPEADQFKKLVGGTREQK